MDGVFIHKSLTNEIFQLGLNRLRTDTENMAIKNETHCHDGHLVTAKNEKRWVFTQNINRDGTDGDAKYVAIEEQVDGTAKYI